MNHPCIYMELSFRSVNTVNPKSVCFHRNYAFKQTFDSGTFTDPRSHFGERFTLTDYTGPQVGRLKCYVSSVCLGWV